MYDIDNHIFYVTDYTLRYVPKIKSDKHVYSYIGIIATIDFVNYTRQSEMKRFLLTFYSQKLY